MYKSFDQEINRTDTLSIKHGFLKEFHKPEDVIPLWVADMDFQSPAEVTEKLAETAKFGIYGYIDVKDDYFQSICHWFDRRYGWQPEQKWMLSTSGIVTALALAVRSLTQQGDAVLIQRPVYYPFTNVILDNERQLINNPLVDQNGYYTIDFEDFEKKIIEHKVKMFILCNPHNPVGRVWTEKELRQMGEICLRHGVIVVSDEIHCDFVYTGHKHTVFAGLSDELAQITITCTAPSKTFNLAGLDTANIFIANANLRSRFKDEIKKGAYSSGNIFGAVACQTAYEYGEAWLENLKMYLMGNINYISSFIEEKLPMLRLRKPEGTYLLWIDFSQLGMTDKDLIDFMLNKAGLWLNQGVMFGPEGSGYMRMNIASPKSVIERAMNQLEKAICSL